jgi:hypothetical protein
MFSDKSILIIGAVAGFAVFLYNVATMEGVMYRPNGQGHDTFTLAVLKDYIIVPFQVGTAKFDAIWANYDHLTLTDRVNLLQLNWVAMTLTGLSVSALVLLLKWIL